MKQLSALLIVGVLLMVPYISIAAGPPGPPPGPPPCWPPPCGIPIDGGITFLAAAGALYAGKKLFRNGLAKNSE